MTTWLKQSTAATVVLGPFVDSTDGVTAETGLTISQADIRLSKNGGAQAQTNNAAGATHMEAGDYSVPLDTTDTNTLGTLRLRVSESGALPVWRDFMVVPANVWDSMFGADLLQVDTRELSSDATAADNAEAFFDGTGYAGTNNVIPTVTTVTNLTNAPTNGDLTAAMVTSVTTAATAATPTAAAVTGAVGSVTGNVGGNVAGSVGSVTGNVGGNVVGSVGSVTGNVGGNVAGSVGSVAAAVTVGTNNDKTGYRLSSTGVDDVLDEVVAGTTTFRQAIRGWIAALLGKSSGLETTTAVYRDIDDTKDVISATVDPDGNRSAVTLDLT